MVPWLVGGDFNSILRNKEKMGGSDKNVSDMMKLQDALNACLLCNLGWNGDIFTWSNRRFKGGLIKERLNRFVASYEWFLRFSGAKVTNVQAIGSDHMPILVEVLGPENQYEKFRKNWGERFHFEEMWAEYKDCEDIVKSIWENEGDFIGKTNACKERLSSWSKRKFKRRVSVVKNLKKNIADLKALPPSAANAVENF